MMRRLVVPFTVFFFAALAACEWTVGPLWAYDDVTEVPACRSCGMSREIFASSRMLVEYDDGTPMGACSLRCAALHLRSTPDRKPKAIRVADYNTGELIDARKAAWVIGGGKEGVMTRRAKWAFGDKAAAEAFIAANGGTPAGFDQALEAAYQDLDADAKTGSSRLERTGHMMSHMGPGALMRFNPAFGDDIYHLHPAGMWMFNYRYMRTEMKDLRAGGSDVDVNSVSPVGNVPFGFMMTPTRMTMDMHMVMAMYGVTGRLTLMGMANYQENSMDMLMNMGMGNVPQSPMRTRGFGDVELTGVYGIGKDLVGSLGLGIPTGSTTETIEMMGMTFRAPYDMQLGSGTFDLKPALTYSALDKDATWNCGGQAAYTWRIGKNDHDYSLGDRIKLTGWLQRAFGPAASWLRLAYSDAGRIEGRDPEIDKILDPVMGAPAPDADPANYGGQRLDLMIGASCRVGPVSFGVEGGKPVYQYLNGLQLKTDWFLTAGVQAMY